MEGKTQVPGREGGDGPRPGRPIPGAHLSPGARPGWLPGLGGLPEGEVAGGPLLTQALGRDAQVACGHGRGGYSVDGIVSVQGRFRYLFVNLVKHSFKLTVTRFWSCPGSSYEALTASSEATASRAGVQGRRPPGLDPHPPPPLPPHLGPLSRITTAPGPEREVLFSRACLGDPGSRRRDLVLTPGGPRGCGSGGREGDQAAVCGLPSLEVANQDTRWSSRVHTGQSREGGCGPV